MDVMYLVRALGALGLLLGMLTAALWAVRRYDLRLPGALVRNSGRRLEVVERLGIDKRRSAILIRRDDREHLVIISPEGQIVVESRPHSFPDLDAQPVPNATRALPQSFTALLDADLTSFIRPGTKGAIPSKRKH
ncbi:flagellar biosynthetic protein FliO [Alteriqipengyuania sp. 357]